jgi:arginine/lysine/ornithine decarboxylase
MDGPAGQVLTQETIDEAVACRLAVARARQEFLAKKDWFFAPWNADTVRDPKSGKRSPVSRGTRRETRDGPELLGAAPRR